MLVDALALLLGDRASSDVVRPGAEKTVIEGAFEFTSTALHRLAPSFPGLGVELDGGRLVLKREISGEGRSRAWVNGSPTTVSVLAQLGALLVDLHGQHETQSLLRPDAQRDMLDAYADAAVERTAARDAHERLRELERREQDLTARREDVRRKADYLRHVVEEIERAAPRNGEVETLDVEAKRLAHADELGRLSRELEHALLDTADLDLRNIAEQRETAAAEFARACSALTAKRAKGAARLAKAVNELLPALGMPGGRFAARLVPVPAPRSHGAEDVVFE